MSFLRILELICRVIGNLVKTVRSLPQSVVTAIRHRRRQAVLDGLETERLDRIRNPSNYLGKS